MERDLSNELLTALEPYRNLKAGNGRYNAPWRSGSDSGSLHVVQDATYGGGGWWKEFVSGDGGNFLQLADRLGVNCRQQPDSTPTTSKRAYRDLADYAEQHGATADIFARAGWEQVNLRGRVALKIPTRTGVRYRYLDGQEPRFRSPQGYESCWYGLERAAGIARDTGDSPLVICNGEPSVVVAQAYGVAACCVTGGSERKLPDDLLQELLAFYGGAILVALDCDAKGKAAAPKLARQLRDAGYKARAVDLALGLGGGDLADYCKLHEGEAWQRLPTLATLDEPGERRLGKSAKILMGIEFPERRWIVPNLLPEGLTICAGKPKMGKSFLFLGIALAAASGGRVLGQLPATPSDVLYLVLEDGERRLQERLRAMGETMATVPAHFEYDDEAHRIDSGILEQLRVWLQERAGNGREKLIIIDTLAMIKPVKSVFRSVYDDDYQGVVSLRKLAQEFQAAIALVHHTNKSKADDVFELISGSHGLTGAVETEMVLYRKDGDPLLSITGKDIASPHYRLRFDDGIKQWMLVGEVEQSGTGLPPLRRQVLELLSGNQCLTPREIAEMLDRPYNNVVQHLKGMRDDGLVESDNGFYRALDDHI